MAEPLSGGAYGGKLIPECPACYAGGVRFLVARQDGRELGFLRITDKTPLFDDLVPCPVWEASEGYVKPAYRQQGVLREMLRIASEHHDVRLLLLERDRFYAKRSYYETLGFSVVFRQGEELFWVLREDFAAELQTAVERSTRAHLAA